MLLSTSPDIVDILLMLLSTNPEIVVILLRLLSTSPDIVVILFVTYSCVATSLSFNFKEPPVIGVTVIDFIVGFSHSHPYKYSFCGVPRGFKYPPISRVVVLALYPVPGLIISKGVPFGIKAHHEYPSEITKLILAEAPVPPVVELIVTVGLGPNEMSFVFGSPPIPPFKYQKIE